MTRINKDTQASMILRVMDNQDLESNPEIILTELRRLKIKPKYQEGLLRKIIKITKILKNPKTRESYLRSYFRVLQEGIDKDGREGSIVIEITKKCNKNCIHCYSKLTGQKQDMPDDVIDSIIRLVRKDFKHVFLTGGEPTLDNRIFPLAENNPDIMFFMFTNGSTMTDNYAKRLSTLGNLIPILSIDGNSQLKHDRLRGKGSYGEVMRAIDHLNKNKVPWGYISLVTEFNANEVLNQEFVKDKIKKGAFIMRYLEYLPVGPKPLRDLIPSGENYYLLEKRKKEIIESDEIYMQETTQNKCTGLLFIDAKGNIKNCPFFHYAKYNVKDGEINKSIKKTRKDWTSYTWTGECPIYADPIGFKNHLEKLGWKHIYSTYEEYLTNPDIAQQLMRNYTKFLEIRAQREL